MALSEALTSGSGEGWILACMNFKVGVVRHGVHRAVHEHSRRQSSRLQSEQPLVASWQFERQKGEWSFLSFDPEEISNLINPQYYLIHGTHDDNVHYQQSMLLSAALEEKDILFRSAPWFHYYPGVSIISKNWVFYKGWYERLEFSLGRWSVVFFF